MISGFVGCGMYAEVIRCFRDMLLEVTPNEAVIVCTLLLVRILDHWGKGIGFVVI